MKTSILGLINKLNSEKVSGLGIIEWATPVPVFGDISNSNIATLGLNPSNREFVEVDGTELIGKKRRFHTLRSLGIDSWWQIQAHHTRMIEDSYKLYFEQNPYDGWFKALDNLMIGLEASYYGGMINSACHLDLIPFATYKKWTSLSNNQRQRLLSLSESHLFDCLKNTSISLLILNGMSVIQAMQKMTGMAISSKEMPSWKLPRANQNHIKGYAFEGELTEIAGMKLGRVVRVIGFNHNIQSSFGVTNNVKNAIRDWIAEYRHEVASEIQTKTTIKAITASGVKQSKNFAPYARSG
ncbi:hypothetical protein [uncultured Methylophaga sp.]|uniref:hypothetical protein n=1 Tax=uncultured Methylophaga sp. TaxID=285271 RepID=UPI00262062B5|nr:hypothetical protein [uncultured Methylophaga sp.]